MSFEDGSEPMQDPFSEDTDEEELTETEEKIEPEENTTTERDPELKSEQEPETSNSENEPQFDQGTPQHENIDVPQLSGVDILRQHSPEEIAQFLMSREYHEENLQVPYAMWRNGTSTGRSRTTIQLNPDIDELVKTAMREFENRYDAEINKADLREFALAYGLMNPDKVFEMAEEWGLQFNN